MNEKDDLLIQALNNLNSKVDRLDTKFDGMIVVQGKNTVVLEQHEMRSTTAEKRLDLLENRQSKIEKKADRIHGFFFYSGALLGLIGCLAALFHDAISTFIDIWKK